MILKALRAFKWAAISKQSLSLCSLHHSPTFLCFELVRLPSFLALPYVHARTALISPISSPHTQLALSFSDTLCSKLSCTWLHLHIFPVFPHKQPLASLCQTRQKKKISLPLTHSHIFRYSAATLHYPPPCFSASPASCSPSLADSPCLHTPGFPALPAHPLHVSVLTSLIHLLFLCTPFSTLCSFFCTALSSAHLFILPILWEEKPTCATAICATSSSLSPVFLLSPPWSRSTL